MNHLRPDELVDAVEDALAPDRRTHLAVCEICRVEVSQLAAILGDTRAIGMPEPSPLFWDRLSHRVRVAIAEEPAATHGFPQWLQWPVLVPFAGLAVLLMMLASAIPVPKVETAIADDQLTRGAMAAVSEDPSADAAEDTWVAVTDLIGPLDIRTVEAAGMFGAPGAAEQAVLDLTSDEQEELIRLLKQELAGS